MSLEMLGGNNDFEWIISKLSEFEFYVDFMSDMKGNWMQEYLNEFIFEIQETKWNWN